MNQLKRELRERLIKMLSDGASLREAAKQIGVCKETANRYARDFIKQRLWKDGPICPHCYAQDNYQMSGEFSQKRDLFRCRQCRAQFTFTVNTIFEASHIPMDKWILASAMLSGSRASVLELQNKLGVTYKSAWFMKKRICSVIGENKPDIEDRSEVPCDACGLGIPYRNEYFRKTRRTSHKFCSLYCYGKFMSFKRAGDRCKRCGKSREDEKFRNFVYGMCAHCYALSKQYENNEDLVRSHELTAELRRTLNEHQEHRATTSNVA